MTIKRYNKNDLQLQNTFLVCGVVSNTKPYDNIYSLISYTDFA